MTKPKLASDCSAAAISSRRSVPLTTTFEVACDNVINGIGFVPAPVGDKGRHVHRVGDCVAIGNLRTVIWRAWDVCMKI